jgi:hypothetical protein
MHQMGIRKFGFASFMYYYGKDRKVRKVSRMLYFLYPLMGLYVSSQWCPIYENQPIKAYPIPPQPSYCIEPSPALFTVAHQCKVP